jgi:hypothetical protein
MVEVIDPTHALYGLRLPLLEIVHHPSPLGHICAVELSPGSVRLIPVAATDPSGIRQPLPLSSLRRRSPVLVAGGDVHRRQ